MTAFIPLVSAGSFTTRNGLTTTSPMQCHRKPTRMAVDLGGPDFSKYLSMIPKDRVNKAPVITINEFANPDFNNVSVRMADFLADQGAGDTLKAGVILDDEQPPSPKLYEKYYDPASVNEAPVITIYSEADGLSYDKHAVCVVQTTVPIRLREAAFLLQADYQKPKLQPVEKNYV